MIGKIVWGVVAIVAILILSVFGFMMYSNAPVVSAQGINKMTVQPNEASINLYISEKNSSAEAAKNQLIDVSDKVLTELVKLGIERKDIQTEQISVNPDYSWSSGSQKVNGYLATQYITVKLTDFSKVSSIIDSAVDSGALVSYINFEISQDKQNEYKKQSLQAASSDAKAKAESTAAGLGKKLGGLVSVESSDFNYVPYNYYRSMDSASPTANAAGAKEAALNIQPTELEISSTVNVKYKLSAW